MDSKLYPINSNGYFIEYNKREQIDSMLTHHYHDHFEIYYQLSGERYYFIKDRSYYVKKGDIVLINTYDLHKTIHVGTKVYERILINFLPEYIEKFTHSITDVDLFNCFSKSTPVLSLSPKEQIFVESLLFKMLAEKKDKQLGYETYSRISLVELLIFLSRISPKQKNNYLAFPSSLHKKISEVTTYINEHFNEELTLQSIADKFYINPYYLCRTFKEVTGFNFTQYLNTVRIRASEELLTTTSLSILEVATVTGYTNSTHFGRVFKQTLGISPLQYRKLNKDDTYKNSALNLRAQEPLQE